MLVLDQRDAYILLSEFTKRAAGGECDLGLIHHPQAEIDRALAFQMLIADLRPHEHAGPRFFVAPAELVEPAADFVAALLVDLGLLIDARAALAHRDDAGNLDGR